jgi:myo-inositol-1(or 4)-monophosphatase
MKTIDLTKRDLRRFVTFAADTAVGAGNLLKRGFNRQHSVRYKGRINPVTEYDTRSERYIVNQINRRFRDHNILAEEGTDQQERSEFLWVIDPLDGTVNYAHRFPIYCVSIGLLYRGEPVVGAVYDPERSELFSASRDQGAHMNSRRIQVSDENRLDRALVATGFAYDVATARKNNLGLFSRMVKCAQGVRRPGSAAIDLCWLAAGRLDAFWEFKLHPWDTAAAVVIVGEAGGKVTKIDGTRYSIFDDEILASNRRLHPVMKKTLLAPTA